MMKNNAEERFAIEALPHLNDLYRTAARLTRNPAIAEDILQEVFLQAWKSFDGYQAGTNCRAWLYKILFFIISRHRRNVVQEARFFQADNEDATLFAGAVAASEISQHLTDEEIRRAVDRLPIHQRAVVLLIDVQEFSYKEVAAILEIPIGTVMSRLNRARKQLRESLTGVARAYNVINSLTAKADVAVLAIPLRTA